MKYRIVVGEVGNEQGHVISTRCTGLKGALRALKRELKKYGQDGWGYIEVGGGTPSSWRRVTITLADDGYGEYVEIRY